MNCGYACSIAAILKILTVLFTLVPAAIMFHVTGSATCYSPDEFPYTEEASKSGNRPLNSNKNNPCPEKWLGIMALIIFSICCIVSLVCLIVRLLVKLYENGIFKEIDFIYHLVAGVAVLLAGCFTISFGALALGKHPYDLASEKSDQFEPELQLLVGVIGLIVGINIYIITALN